MLVRPRPLQVVHSIPSERALVDEVVSAYAVEHPLSCRFFRRGVNDTYLLLTPADRHIVRLYRTGWRSPEQIAYELELLLHLAAAGVSVSTPLAARDGALLRTIAAPEGPRQMVVFNYAYGAPISWSNPDHCYLAGRAAAAMHAGSDGFVSAHSRFELDLAYLVDGPLGALRPFLAQRPEDLEYLQELAHKLCTAVLRAAEHGLDWGLCHGDLTAGNIHVAGGDRLTLFDFDFAGTGWRAYDLAAVQWRAMWEKNDEVWNQFVRGYREIRPLPSRDVAAVPLFHAISHVFYLGFHATNVPYAGSSNLVDGYLANELDFLRVWEREHLAAGKWVPHRCTRSIGQRAGASGPIGSTQSFRDDSATSSTGAWPVVHSVPSADAIQSAVAEAYRIPAPTACHLLTRYVNDTFLIGTLGARYIARVYRASWRSIEDVSYECELLWHLAANGVSVSAPVRAADGRYMLSLEVPEGTRDLVLFTAPEGRRLPSGGDDGYLTGRAAAGIHAASDGFVSRYPRFKLDLGYLVDRPLERIRGFLADRPQDQEYVEALGSKMRSAVLGAAGRGLEWGVCHGELNRKKLELAEDGSLSVLDFDWCGPGWRAWDFAPIQWIAQFRGDDDVWGAFVEGYREVRPIRAVDLDAAPVFHAMSHLFYLGEAAADSANSGISGVSRKIDKELSFFRRWEADHLGGE